jgi:hypothetical protein
MKLLRIRMFLISSGLMFFVTANAKFISASGSAPILQSVDPILGVPFATIFWIAGWIELIVAYYCIAGKNVIIQIGIVAWLATNFLMYRICLQLIGYRTPCACLGNLSDSLHISAQTADTAMKLVLAYLLIGSFACLLYLWKRNCNGNYASDKPNFNVVAAR